MKNTGTRIFGGTPYRVARTLGVGLLLGVALSFAVVFARAQESTESVPLVTALKVVALADDLDVMLLAIPDADVVLPTRWEYGTTYLEELAHGAGLVVCWTGRRSAVIYPAGEVGCSTEGVPRDEVAEPQGAPAEVVPEPAPEVESERDAGIEVEPAREIAPVRLRVRLVQLDEVRAADLGIDWREGAFRTASQLVAGIRLVAGGYFPSSSLDEVFAFLEQEGVARRLEDVALVTRSGRTVDFNRGGSINVSLVGAGAENIARTYQYGLGLTLTPERDGDAVVLEYTFTDSNPSNVSDPTNVQIASTTSDAEVLTYCGESVVLASLFSSRDEGQGAGLPHASRVPGLGYVAGVGSDRESRLSMVLTVDVACPDLEVGRAP